MAELETIRPINLPQSQEVYDNDVFVIDSETGGVRKIPKDKVMTKIDDTLTETGQAADAKKVGDELDAINDTLDENIPLIQNPTKTVSGEVAHFTDGAEMPAKSVVVNIEPVQSGTGTPSPDNVRQISGWESVSVFDTGVNVWDEEWVNGRWAGNNGVLNTAFSTYVACKNKIPVKPNTTYYLYVDTSISTGREVVWYDRNGDWISDVQGTDSNAPFTTPNNAYFMTFNLGGGYGTTYNHDISINYPATDTEYHAYNPNSSTKTVNLGRTVYGGTLDVVSGVLTVTHGYRLFDNSVSCYSVTTNYGTGFNRALYSTLENEAKGSIETPILSDKFSYTNRSALGLYAGNINNNSMLCLGVSDTITTTAEMQAWAGQNPFVIVYELAIPQTYQLTPTQVNTLLGENNVWADAGAVEVTYRRDINLALEQAIISLGANV